MPATMTVVPFMTGVPAYPIANTVYQPTRNLALNLYYNWSTDTYGFSVTSGMTGAVVYDHGLLYPPHPVISSDPKSRSAKVTTLTGHEYIFDLSPLWWNQQPIFTVIGWVYPWRFRAGFGYYDECQVNVAGPNSLVIVSGSRREILDTLSVSLPIVGPPVVDPQNQYARVRLQGNQSLFLDLFELARGNLNYYRYDTHGAPLVDEPLFDPNGGMDITLDANNQLSLWRSRSGQLVGSVTLPAQPIRPLAMNPHHRLVEAIMPGGQIYHLDLSHIDGSTPVSLNLQPINVGGTPLAASDLSPPPMANTSGLQFSSIGPDGVVRIAAPAGSVEPHSYVSIGNVTNRSLETLDVMADENGAFVAYALADSADSICVFTADVAGNLSPEACFELNASTVDVDVERPRLVTALLGPSPNPSRGDVLVPFTLARAGRVTIDIMDVAGRRVRQLVRGSLPAGTHEITWDGRNDRAQPVRAGFYFARFTADGREQVKRIVRIATP
jgi:hypothetical protein